MIKLNNTKLNILSLLLILQQCQLSFSSSNYPFHKLHQQRAVTFGSLIKLMNSAYSVRLHLLDSNFANANNITGVEETMDPNSYWIVKSTSLNGWKRGDPVPCGAKVKFEHQLTETKLYSRSSASAPITKVHQEIIGNPNESIPTVDSGDIWQVICSKKQNFIWIRDAPIHLRHIDSQVYLGATGAILGKTTSEQYEIVGMNYLDGSSTNWMAVEGIYIQPSISTGTKFLRK